MINKKWKEEFEKFLHDKNIFDSFFENYKNQYLNFHIDIFDEVIDVYDYFYFAFDWEYTDEGDDFWLNINDEWYDYCNDNNLDEYDILIK